MHINSDLLALAEMRCAGQLEKRAFVPAGGGMDPAMAGGAPPMDPAAMGGGGGAPGMDPAAMGGAPPMDPSMGGMPPGGGTMGAPPPPAFDPEMIRTIIRDELAKSGGGGMSANGGNSPVKPVKADINTIAMDVWQIKKLLTPLFENVVGPIPPELIDGPNRDLSTGMPVQPGATNSTSTMSSQPQGQQGAQGASPAGPQGPPSDIQPMQPMPAAAGPGQAKQSSLSELISLGTPLERMGTRAEALIELLKRRR